MLYNWYAVDNSSSLCPQGWHVPNDSEFSDLANELGSNAAAKLKESGGFTALLAGWRDIPSGNYSELGSWTYFWTSNYFSGSTARFRYLQSSSSSTFGSTTNKKAYGFSVRCLEDN